MLVKCRACKSRTAVVIKKKDLDDFLKNGAGGQLRAVSPVVAVALIGLVKTMLGWLRSWHLSRNTLYVICPQCGHYELFDKPPSGAPSGS
jgi:hypothetical protein